jgi:hypothetical protein
MAQQNLGRLQPVMSLSQRPGQIVEFAIVPETALWYDSQES